MPAITTTIDRDQREGLYELVRNHLSSIEDFCLALLLLASPSKRKPMP